MPQQPTQPPPQVAAPSPVAAPAQPPPPVEAPPAAPAFTVRVVAPNFERTLPGENLTRAGMFVQAHAPLPPLFTRIKLSIQRPQHAVDLEADVVRHVGTGQALSWGFSGPGFAVQFVNLNPMLREAIDRLLEGDDTEAPVPTTDDLLAGRFLDAAGHRNSQDYYAFLGVASDAECSEVRHRARQALQELDFLTTRPLSARQRQQAAQVREWIEAALTQLGTPARRADYDASRGNFRGVARCLAAGLALPELEALRATYLSSRPKNETAAKLRSVMAASAVRAGQEPRALEEYEAALALDPLNLQIHQIYWQLKYRVARGRGVGA
jgi:serine/threonine-protein kinase